MVAHLFAHAGQFTWDEALLVFTPIALVAGVLILANSRAKKLQAEREEGTTPEPDPAVDPDATTSPDATDSPDLTDTAAERDAGAS